MGDLNREVWEGWTPQQFIYALQDEVSIIMNGNSWHPKFKTKEELRQYIVGNQPYYKKEVPEVVEHFTKLYFPDRPTIGRDYVIADSTVTGDIEIAWGSSISGLTHGTWMKYVDGTEWMFGHYFDSKELALQDYQIRINEEVY